MIDDQNFSKFSYFFFIFENSSDCDKIYLSDVSFHCHWYRTIGQTLMSRPVKSTKCCNMKLLKFLIFAIFFNIICPFTTKTH